MDRIVADTWAQTLGRTHIGVNDNFFELGGHSLLATQLISRVRETLHMELPVRTVFESPTVAALTEAVMAALSAEQPLQMPSIKQALRNTEMPLSYAAFCSRTAVTLSGPPACLAASISLRHFCSSVPAPDKVSTI